MFSSEFSEISKNNFFQRTPLVAASGDINSYIDSYIIIFEKPVVRDFQNQKRRFRIPKSRTRLKEKRKEKEQSIAKRYAFHSDGVTARNFEQVLKESNINGNCF